MDKNTNPKVETKELVKRKRGRPRKIKKEEPKKNKKRGRKKQIEKQYVKFEDIKHVELKSKEIETKSIIVHLPINIKKYQEKENNNFMKDFLKYNPETINEPSGYDVNDINQTENTKEPYGFDINQNTDFLPIGNFEKEKIKNEKEYNYKENDKMVKRKVKNVMLEFENLNEKKYFQTKVCCWHCCHTFEDMPCGIPLYYEDDIFHIKGVFCSFNCALTYNYNSKENDNIIQERESLIYLLYKKIKNEKDKDLKYAPEKETLEMFGGNLTIEEFRNNNSTYKMVFPPILSIIPQMEEIKILETTNEPITNNLLTNNQSNNEIFSKNTSLSKLFFKKN